MAPIAATSGWLNRGWEHLVDRCNFNRRWFINPQRLAKQKAKSFMKMNFVRHTSLGLAAGLVFTLGCARPAAETEQPRTVIAPTAVPYVVAQAAPAVDQPVAPAAPASPAATPPVVATDTNPPAILQRIPPTIRPESVTLTPGLSEVVKLAQAGVGEEVILAYVDKYPGAFNVGSEQILYLNDLGVTSTVITALLKHDGSNVAAAVPAPSVVQTQAVSNVPMNPVYPAAPATEPAPQVEAAPAPPPTTEVSYFYDSLSPYGSWLYLSGYGWCWQPTVAVSTPAWRPYMDRGRWYWSDSGWYWNSDYSWGWAAFHYGRWYNHGRCGWVWTPGTVWGPSWVSWRYTDGYCGWAPLPPEAHYRVGVGFTYYGHGVSVGFDFGISSHCYSWVSYGNFCNYAPYRYCEPRHQSSHHYKNSTVVNNYGVINNNTVINRGIGRETVAARAGGQNRIREVSVQARSAQELSGGRAGMRADQIERRGNENVVYRPELPRTAPSVRTASFGTRTGGGGQGQSTVARANNNNAPSSSGPAPIIINRSTVSGGVTGGTPSASLPSSRTARSSEPQRGQTTVTRNNVGSGNTAATPVTSPNANTPSRGQSDQPRTGRSLFGESGANTPATRGTATSGQNTAPQRGTAARGTEANVAGAIPRSQPHQNYSAPTSRVYPQASAPTERASQTQQSPNRVETRQPATSSPRAYEQGRSTTAPAYSAPAPSAPAQSAPRASASSGSPSSGGRASSGGGSSSGSRGVERGR